MDNTMQKTNEMLLNEVFASPAKETLENRYSAKSQNIDAGCQSGCGGVCRVAG